MKIAHLDYETRSAASLPDVGAYRHAIDPTADILMAGVSWEESDEVVLWVNPLFEADGMGCSRNAEACDMLREADEVYAHNAPFEHAVTWARGLKHDFRVPVEKWRCTSAMARVAGLPRSLEQVGDALSLTTRKDKRGKDLIKLFSMPQKDGLFIDPRSRLDEWFEFGGYCKTDVVVEKLVHRALRQFELKGDLLETFLFDLRMNERGIPVNVGGLDRAAAIIAEVQGNSSEDFKLLTGINPTQREKVRELVGLPDMQAETVEAAIKELEEYDNPMPNKLRILKLYQNLSYSAVAKVASMRDCVCPDGRVRGCHIFYGTGPGRWAATLIQPQNFKKTPKWMRPIMHDVYRKICEGWSDESLSLVYGEPLELISGIIRHFIHGAGELLDGDYSAIQARIILWLAGQEDVLKLWADGKDVYKWMASHIYNIEESAVDADQREVGKRVVLGCGFQMGAPKFQNSCLEQYQLTLPLELCERGVAKFRALHPKVVNYWYYLNNQCKAAIASPGTPAGPFLVQTVAGVPFLLFRLPSGRFIAYPHPKIEPDPEWGTQITYWGQLPQSTQWGRIKLYGGKLAENITMGVEADIMAYGSRTAEARSMAPFTLVHDQALAERTDGHTPGEYAAALATKPVWAATLPVKVEAHVAPYFSK